MPPRETTVERFVDRIKRKPVIAAVILAGSLVIAVATFTDAVEKIVGLFSRQSPAAARLELSKLSLDYTAEDFFKTAKKGDAYPIQLFLTAGMDPNLKDEQGNTPLMYAAASGHDQAVRSLLDAGARVNERRSNGMTALTFAASQTPDFLKLLLDAGADLDAKDRTFVEAASHANPRVFPTILKAGITAQATEPEALFAAAGTTVVVSEDQLGETVKALLKLGVNPNARNREGRTALLLAADLGHLSTARTLVDGGADVNAPCKCPAATAPDWTPLMVALVTDHTEIADFLLISNADPTFKSATGDTVLIVAANKTDGDMVRKVLQKGADVRVTDAHRRTALMAAMNNSLANVKLVSALVDGGADINAQDEDGWTALMWGVLNLKDESAAYLMDHGADVNAKSTTGKTVLMIAAEKCHPDMATVLLNHGARVNERDSRGRTAIQYAKAAPEVDKADYLSLAGGGRQAETIRLLRRAGARE
jgi:uncharacterized protein